MWWTYLEQGGPLMFAVLAAWVVVLAGVVDRGLYALGRAARRPARRARALRASGAVAEARRLASTERQRALRGVARIDAVSQLATSLGLFGTVVGIAQGFMASGGAADATRSLDGLASGLSTALFTTIGGLVVFLFGQLALLVFHEWLEACERGLVGGWEDER
jgi:biopolymer transport protein ExbB/TolQ